MTFFCGSILTARRTRLTLCKRTIVAPLPDRQEYTGRCLDRPNQSYNFYAGSSGVARMGLSCCSGQEFCHGLTMPRTGDSAPMVDEGAGGIAFVEAALSSHAEGGRLLDFQPAI